MCRAVALPTSGGGVADQKLKRASARGRALRSVLGIAVSMRMAPAINEAETPVHSVLKSPYDHEGRSRLSSLLLAQLEDNRRSHGGRFAFDV